MGATLSTSLPGVVDSVVSPYSDDTPAEVAARSRRRLLLLCTLTYAAWYLYTRRAKSLGREWGHRWAATFAAAVCRAIAVGMGLSLTVKYDGDIDDLGLQSDHRGLVAAVGPHGVFPIAMLGIGAFKFRPDTPYAEDGLKELSARFAGASILFSIPMLRELLLLMGVRDVSRPCIRKLLASEHSVAIQPGGIWEMVMCDSSQEALYYQRSLGFVRLAMEYGRPLLPCYSFGENQLYEAHGGHGLRLWIAKKLRVGLPFFYGRWGIPLLLLPRPSHVHFVVGRRVPTTPGGVPNPNPTDAEVEAVFDRYTDEVCRLFVANAPKYLPSDVAARGLQIHRVGMGVVKTAKLAAAEEVQPSHQQKAKL